MKPGRVPRQLARIYNDLFERRQEGDYIDFVSFAGSQVLTWMNEARQFVEHITTFVGQEDA